MVDGGGGVDACWVGGVLCCMGLKKGERREGDGHRAAAAPNGRQSRTDQPPLHLQCRSRCRHHGHLLRVDKGLGRVGPHVEAHVDRHAVAEVVVQLVGQRLSVCAVGMVDRSRSGWLAGWSVRSINFPRLPRGSVCTHRHTSYALTSWRGPRCATPPRTSARSPPAPWCRSGRPVVCAYPYVVGWLDVGGSHGMGVVKW